MRRNALKTILSTAILSVALMSCNTPRYGSHNHTYPQKEKNYRVENTGDDYALDGWQKNVKKEAMTWIGTPYKYADATKGEGTDCSGLVLRVFQHTQGWILPRNSAKQAEYCKPVKEEDVRTGDLVFFATGTDSAKVTHVGIMLDREKFIHASSSKGVVVSRMTTAYYRKHFLMYGRLPETMANNR